jgi:hypothetical protein
MILSKPCMCTAVVARAALLTGKLVTARGLVQMFLT